MTDDINERCGPVDPAEAYEILARFVHSHFDDGREKARFSIPANPQWDDDLRLHAFIRQSSAICAANTALRTALAKAEAERDAAVKRAEAAEDATRSARRALDAIAEEVAGEVDGDQTTVETVRGIRYEAAQLRASLAERDAVIGELVEKAGAAALECADPEPKWAEPIVRLGRETTHPVPGTIVGWSGCGKCGACRLRSLLALAAPHAARGAAVEERRKAAAILAVVRGIKLGHDFFDLGSEAAYQEKAEALLAEAAEQTRLAAEGKEAGQ